jgi:hypothetical protein
MSNPDWTEAPEGATHWDSRGDCFCTEFGWWNRGEYQEGKTPQWGTDRHTPRPVGPPSNDWVDGWPPVGFHGECRWGSSVEWFECVVIPVGQVVVQGSAGNWNVVDDIKSYGYEFQELHLKPQTEQAQTVETGMAWDGIGWPPIGKECIFISDDDRECIVVPVAYFENSVVFAAGDDYHFSYDGCCNLACFRALPSKKEKDEREDLENFVELAIASGLKPKGIVNGMIEKGYRLVKG